MEMIVQRPLVAARNDVEDQLACIADFAVQVVERFTAQVVPESLDLVTAAAFEDRYDVDEFVARIEIIFHAAFELVDQFLGLHLLGFLFVAVLEEEDKVAQLFERVFILYDLPRERVEFEECDPFLDIVRIARLFVEQRFEFGGVLSDLGFYLFSELLEIGRVDIFQDQAQVQLCIRRRAEFFGVYFVERIDNAVVETEDQRGIRAARLFRVVHDHQSRQQREPFFTGIMVDAGVLYLDDEYRSGVGRHLFVEQFRGGRFHHHDAVLAEYVAAQQGDGFVGVPGHDCTDHAVHPFEIHGPLAAVQEVANFGFCRVMGALADHLFERVHQVVPVRFVDVARYADHVAVFA